MPDFETLSRVKRKQQEQGEAGSPGDYYGSAYGALRSGRDLRAKRNAKRHRRRHAFTWLYSLIIALAVVAVLRIFVIEITPVDGPSMENTFFTAEQILVERISYHVRKPKRGEIVICRYPGSPDAFVKRVIALEGETVEVINGAVWVDGEPLDESAYWRGTISAAMDKVTVPGNHIFVVGDNRNRSIDSRDPRVGPIPMDHVNGKAMALIWPLARLHFL